ncbi:DoxX family protein [Mucilaginibacter sp.]|jgi:hypothetical protein|uniref:DoxX family protein n=1 Tax=Mucilaginibacter sp. TaxID=1882438 RepID=UPI002C9D788A|nr:DoxX family protein [Mucilaginibacter sp.]HTI60938.1 DoxX family protein [Mucilaginibacter sp.]
MNTIIWIVQALLAGLFLYSGTCKTLLSQQKLLAIGQTGAELPMTLIRFIGVAEILGAIGLILPVILGTAPELTAMAAIGFSIIMVLAARFHYHRHETKNVVFNILILCLCVAVVWYRF